MAHIVAEPCFDCKYTDCVVVCPVDCFYEGAQMLYIHPDECIDCEACVPECPVEAIFHEDNLPEEWKDFTALNAEQSPLVSGDQREERRPRGRVLRQVAQEEVTPFARLGKATYSLVRTLQPRALKSSPGFSLRVPRFCSVRDRSPPDPSPS